MRKCTKKIITLFMAGNEGKTANMTTDGKEIRLFGRVIIAKEVKSFKPDHHNYLLTLAGYPGNTTKERLNSFLDHIGFRNGGFTTRKGTQYFCNVEIDSKDTVRIDPDLEVVDIGKIL